MSGANCEFARSKISPIGLTADGLWDLQCWGYDWGAIRDSPPFLWLVQRNRGRL